MLGEAEARSGWAELLRLVILKGRPGGRLGLDFASETAGFEIFASRLLERGRLGVTGVSLPFGTAIAVVLMTARCHHEVLPMLRGGWLRESLMQGAQGSTALFARS